MSSWFADLFSSSDFMPHGMCFLWTPSLMWLHGISDSLMAIIYFSISLLAIYFVRKRDNLPFRWIFWSFPVFIGACGATHLMSVITIWEPVYWLSGGIKVLSVIVSLFTVTALFVLMPEILKIPTSKEMTDVNSKLVVSNKELESFSYSVSHDLRAPLRGIDGFSQALLEDYGDKLDKEGKEYLQEIRACTTEMAELIDSLLLLSRVTRKELQLVEINLSEIGNKILAKLYKNQPERKVEILIEDNILAFGDKSLLTTMLQNLLENA